MNINTIKENDIEIAVVSSSDILIAGVQSALDFISTVSFETGCNNIIINKSAICEDIFHLSTKLAGEIVRY